MKAKTAIVALSVVCLAPLTASPAHADDKKKACTDSYAQAQTLRDAHKLREAREQLHICSQSTCKAFIVKDCTAWLVDIEGRVPSIVLSAKDSAGQPLTDVAVSMDGASLAPKLDGDAIEVDPGQHTFTFVASDGTKVEQPFAVNEGQKAQAVAVTIPTAASQAAIKPQTTPTPPPEQPFWTTPREIAVAAGGVGVAGLVVGGIFGLMASSAWNNAQKECGSPSSCPQRAQALSDHNTTMTDATISTVGFIAGGVLVAGGATLWLVAGHSSSEATQPAQAGLGLSPVVGPRVAGLSLKGGF